LPLAQKEQWDEHHGHPAKQQCIAEIDFARPDYTTPGKNHTRQQRDRPWKPPGHMENHKLIGRHAEEIVRLISEPTQVSQPFGPDQKTKIMREVPLRPDVPGRHDQKKNHRIFPPQQRAKSYPRFAIKNREQNENHSGVNNAEQAFR
jgi:hypothetical protein